MSFSPLMMQQVAARVDDLPSNPQVIEMGKQTFGPTLGGALTKQQHLMKTM